MDVLDKVYDMVYCELEDISKKDKMSMQDLDALGKLVDIVKDIDKIGEMTDSGYSQNSYRGSGNSYGSRYNRNSYRGSGNSYSRDESKEHMLNQLEQVMNMAVDDRDRNAINKLMQQMQQN